jgi:hypothetical protein
VVSQDLYLAAADHYLWALTWVLEHPSQVVLVGDSVPLYEIWKIIKNLFVTTPPQSPPSFLSLKWGERGVIDAVTILFGPSALPGK